MWKHYRQHLLKNGADPAVRLGSPFGCETKREKRMESMPFNWMNVMRLIEYDKIEISESSAMMILDERGETSSNKTSNNDIKREVQARKELIVEIIRYTKKVVQSIHILIIIFLLLILYLGNSRCFSNILKLYYPATQPIQLYRSIYSYTLILTIDTPSTKIIASLRIISPLVSLSVWVKNNC